MDPVSNCFAILCADIYLFSKNATLLLILISWLSTSVQKPFALLNRQRICIKNKEFLTQRIKT